jgi:hypothetical protein
VQRGKNITEWCKSQDPPISRPVFYDMRRKGTAPHVVYFPGRRDGLITPEAEQAWERQRNSRKAQAIAKRERQLRSIQATQAAKVAAKVLAAKRKAAR